MRIAGVLTFLVLMAQQPQFRGGVELVTVDVRVVAADGTALVGLGRDDFELKVGGKPRQVKSLQFVRVLATRDVPSGPDAPAVPRAAPPTGGVGRTLILVFDHEHIRTTNERIAVDGAMKALDALDPLDRVALVTMPNGRIEVNLTRDREEVRRALRNVVGRATDLPFGAPAPVVCALPVLRGLFEGLAGIAGPKTVLFVSEGFSCELRQSRMDYRMEFEDLAKAAGASRVQVYVLQPNTGMIVDANRKLPGGVTDGEMARRDDALKTLEDIAGVTGGDLFRLSGTADAVFERVLRETAGYYELAFEPLESERNGKDHSIGVKVNRPKVTVRARPSFSIAPPR